MPDPADLSREDLEDAYRKAIISMATDAGGAKTPAKPTAPGYLTTEFYLVIALFALVIGNKLLDLGLNAESLISIGLGVAGYPVGRGLSKQKNQP